MAKLPGVKNVVIESRPEFIEENKVAPLIDLLRPDQDLFVVMGLETSDDFISTVCINKGYGLAEFEEAARVLHRCGAGVVINCFTKPSFINEREALRHSVETGRYFYGLPESLNLPDLKLRLFIQRSFNQENGFLSHLASKRYFAQLWEWTVVEMVRRIHPLTGGQILHVDCEEDFPIPFISVHNRNAEGGRCECNHRVKEGAEIYNRYQDIDRYLETAGSCDCREIWREEVENVEAFTVLDC